MITINRGNLYQAFSLAGWLDTETGGIRRCHARIQPDGKYRYQIDSDMLEQPDRYKRLPYMSTARMLTGFIEAKGIGQVVLDEHGIDLAKYRSDSYFVYVAYNELGGEAERAEFCERAFRMIECLGLVDEFDDFSDGKIFEEIECWCRDNGYSLYGSWSDWDDPNNVDRFLRGEA